MINNTENYKLFQLKWLLCIELLYKYLCSLIPNDLLQKFNWYVGESFVIDSNNNTRSRDFFNKWAQCAFKDFLVFLHLEEIQYHQICTMDM